MCTPKWTQNNLKLFNSYTFHALITLGHIYCLWGVKEYQVKWEWSDTMMWFDVVHVNSLSQNALSAIFDIFKVRAPSYNTK